MTFDQLKEIIEKTNKIYWKATSTDKMVQDLYSEEAGSLEDSLSRLEFLLTNNADRQFSVLLKSKKNGADTDSAKYIVGEKPQSNNNRNQDFNGFGGMGFGGLSIQGLLGSLTETMNAKNDFHLAKQQLVLEGIENKHRNERIEEKLKEREEKIKEKEAELKEKEKELDKAISEAEKAIESRSASMMLAMEKTFEGLFGLKMPASTPIQGQDHPQQPQTEQNQIIEKILEHLLEREKHFTPDTLKMIYQMIAQLDHVNFEKIKPGQLLQRYQQLIESVK